MQFVIKMSCPNYYMPINEPLRYIIDIYVNFQFLIKHLHYCSVMETTTTFFHPSAFIPLSSPNHPSNCLYDLTAHQHIHSSTQHTHPSIQVPSSLSARPYSHPSAFISLSTPILPSKCLHLPKHQPIPIQVPSYLTAHP